MDTSQNTNIGWKIPIGVSTKTGEIAGVDLETDISQSIIILLSTRPGERLGHRAYGANLLRFTFETVSSSLIKQITDEITAAITRWEQRVENINVDALHTEAEYKLIFRISYNIVESGIRSGVLYEFSGNG